MKDDFDFGLYYTANIGNVFYFESNHNAPNGKIVRYDLDLSVSLLEIQIDLQEAGFVTIVPEQPHAVLKDASLTNESYLLLQYSHNVQDKLFVVPLPSVEHHTISDGEAVNGTVHTNGSTKPPNLSTEDATSSGDEWIGLPDAQQVELPVGSSVLAFRCRRDEPRVFINCSGYTLAGRTYKYTFNPILHTNGTKHGSSNGTTVSSTPKPFGSLSIWRQSRVEGFEPDQWSVEQVWVPNPNDGVKVPMFIIRDKSIVKTGDAFCLLYGYF
jgi:hypothetical protein